MENVRQQTRLHPRCGTSFLLVVMVISILVFSVASTALLSVLPALAAMRGSFLYRLIMIVFKLLLHLMGLLLHIQMVLRDHSMKQNWLKSLTM